MPEFQCEQSTGSVEMAEYEYKKPHRTKYWSVCTWICRSNFLTLEALALCWSKCIWASPETAHCRACSSFYTKTWVIQSTWFFQFHGLEELRKLRPRKPKTLAGSPQWRNRDNSGLPSSWSRAFKNKQTKKHTPDLKDEGPEITLLREISKTWRQWALFPFFFFGKKSKIPIFSCVGGCQQKKRVPIPVKGAIYLLAHEVHVEACKPCPCTTLNAHSCVGGNFQTASYTRS